MKSGTVIDFELHTYPYRVVFFFGCSEEEVDLQIKKKKIKPGGEYHIEDGEEAVTKICESGHVIALFRSLPVGAVQMGFLAHEVVHIVHSVCSAVGLRHSADSEEAYAYLAQYITEQVYRKLGRKIKKAG